MKIVKPSADHTERFKALLPAGTSIRPMFGCTAAFVNGNMACGTWEEGVMVRLSKEDRIELEDVGGGPFCPMGRKMGDYMLLTPKIVADDGNLREWMERSVRVTAKLPAKVPKERKSKASKSKK